jgi:hypothetical protein
MTTAASATSATSLREFLQTSQKFVAKSAANTLASVKGVATPFFKTMAGYVRSGLTTVGAGVGKVATNFNALPVQWKVASACIIAALIALGVWSRKTDVE